MALIEVVVLVLLVGVLIYRLLSPLREKLEQRMRSALRPNKTASGDRIIDVDAEKSKKE